MGKMAELRKICRNGGASGRWMGHQQVDVISKIEYSFSHNLPHCPKSGDVAFCLYHIMEVIVDNQIKKPAVPPAGAEIVRPHQRSKRLRNKRHEGIIMQPAAYCQAGCEMSQLFARPLIQNRLAWLSDRSGLPPAVIVEALVRAADPQLLRVASALTPAAVVWLVARGGER